MGRDDAFESTCGRVRCSKSCLQATVSRPLQRLSGWSVRTWVTAMWWQRRLFWGRVPDSRSAVDAILTHSLVAEAGDGRFALVSERAEREIGVIFLPVGFGAVGRSSQLAIAQAGTPDWAATGLQIELSTYRALLRPGFLAHRWIPLIGRLTEPASILRPQAADVAEYEALGASILATVFQSTSCTTHNHTHASPHDWLCARYDVVVSGVASRSYVRPCRSHATKFCWPSCRGRFAPSIAKSCNHSALVPP